MILVSNCGPAPGASQCAHTWPWHRTQVGAAPLLDVVYDVVTSLVLSKKGRGLTCSTAIELAMRAGVCPIAAHMSEACTQSQRRGANIAAAPLWAPPSDQISQPRRPQPVARGRAISGSLEGSVRPIEPRLRASDRPDMVRSSLRALVIPVIPR
jgi:hypothetical protein